MEFLLALAILFIGSALLWGLREHQERLIAKQGYDYYIRFSSRWKKKREHCYKRFGYRCALCYSPHHLQAHHRTYDRLYNEREDDLTCLCRDCHAKAPKSKQLYVT